MLKPFSDGLIAKYVRSTCLAAATALFCIASGTAFANGPPFSINLELSAQGNSGLSPGSGSEFTPKSSITLNPIVRDQYGNPADLKRYPCTPVYQIENVSHGLSNDTRPVASIIGNHLIFGPATGSFEVSAHCLEDPKINTNGNMYSLSTGTDTFAQTAGTKYVQDLTASGVLPQNYFEAPTVVSSSTGSPPNLQSATGSTSSGSGSSNALLIGAAIAGVAALAVAAGAAAKSSTSSGSSGTVNCSYNVCTCPPGAPCGASVTNEQTQCLSQDVLSAGQSGCQAIDSSDGYTVACQPNAWCYEANGSAPGVCESSRPSQCGG